MGPTEASAIVAGEGPLAGAAGTAVAAAGFGRIGLVAADGADAAAAKLGLLVPETVVEPYPVALEAGNTEAIVAGSDVVLACAASREEQELVNDACCAQGLPFVVGELCEWIGLVLAVRPGRSACRRCGFAGGPSSAGRDLGTAPPGTLEALSGVVGSIQALEAVKLVAGAGEPLLDRRLSVDGREMSVEISDVVRQDGCPACARVPAAPQS